MADPVTSQSKVRLQQTLHGYSDGHRLLASSIDLPQRDAKTLLMMSDASGPAAVIGEEGYLTGYPLTESGCYAFARTWPAPEMPRPGCVWTHTILVDFSDIPALQTAKEILRNFRRPQGDERSYRVPLSPACTEEFLSSTIPEEAVRRILNAVYSNPTRPVVSTALSVSMRDDLVLAMWDQQWPRLKRNFRFCTLSFADRSAGSSIFDLQFLPPPGRVRPSQFKGSLDADKQDFPRADWLDDAVMDLQTGADHSLRGFLRSAGSDVGGREAFVPLTALHSLSLDFDKDPAAVESAIALLDQTISPTHGIAARTLITKAALSSIDSLDLNSLQFVISNFDLIDSSAADIAADGLGRAIWKTDPDALFSILHSSAHRAIADRAIAGMPRDVLLKGVAATPSHLRDLIELRPDIATDKSYWAMPEANSPEFLHIIARAPEIASATIDAMIQSKRQLVVDACNAFGNEAVLRRILGYLDRHAMVDDNPARSWLYAMSSHVNVLAKVLSEATVESSRTLEAVARAVSPYDVPNALGDDPWFVAIRKIAETVDSPYLAAFLMTRAFSGRSSNAVDLVQASFDTIYQAVERSEAPDDAWNMLEQRLYHSYWWPNWDRCFRIRQTTVGLYLHYNVGASRFVKITKRDDVFAELVGNLADAIGGRRYLRSVRDVLLETGANDFRLHAVKHALR